MTQIRIKVIDPRPNQRYIQLNAKQFDIDSFKLIKSSIYHPKKKKFLKKCLDKRMESKLTYINKDMQLSINKELFEKKCNKNLHNFVKNSREYEQFENNRFVTIYWNLPKNNKCNKKMNEIYSKGYFIYFTLQLKTSLTNPTGPISFQNICNSKFFIKDCTFGSTRNLFPCQDTINDQYYFSNVKISLRGKDNASYKVICTGEQKQILKSNELICYEFTINKKLYPTYFGLVIGQLEERDGGSFINKIYHIKDYQIGDKFNEEIQNKLKYYQDKILQYDNSGSMILIPGLNKWNSIDMYQNYLNPSITPYHFYDFFIVNQEFYLQSNYLEGTAFYYSQFLYNKFLINILKNVVFNSIEGYWLIIGTCGYLLDKMVHFVNGKSSCDFLLYQKRKLFFKGIENGKDKFPINNPKFYNYNQIYYNDFYQLKASLIINQIASLLEIDHKSIPVMFWIVNYKPITIRDYFKSIKKRFSYRGLYEMISYIIEKTGTMRVEMHYQYNRKLNKIDLQTFQYPMAVKYFIKSNKNRFEIENFYDFQSKAQLLVLSIKKEMQKQIDQYNELFLDKINKEVDSIVLVNKNYITVKKIQTKIPFLLFESSNRNYNNKWQEIQMNQIVQNQKLDLNVRVKKNNNKKDKNDDKRSNNDKSSIHNEKISKTEILSQANSTLFNHLNYEGGEIFSFKIFPDNNFQQLIEFVTYESEDVLIDQFVKALKNQKELSIQLQLIDSMGNNLKQSVINQLFSYIKRNDINVYSKLRILQIFESSKEFEENSRISDILNGILEKLKFENDGTLKLQKFDKMGKMLFFFKLIGVLFKYDNIGDQFDEINNKQKQNDDTLILQILTFLQKNDNSINNYNDFYYQGFLLKILLNSRNQRHFDNICFEILRYMKIEYYDNPKSIYLLSIIITQFCSFILNNLQILHFNLQPNKNLKFSLLQIFTENDCLKENLDYFRKLLKKYKYHPQVGILVYKHKLIVKQKIKDYKFIDIILYSLKYVQELRDYSQILSNNVLQELVIYLENHEQECHDIQKYTLKSIETIAKLLWEQMTCNLSLVDTKFKYLYMQIYYLIFNEFIPICYQKQQNYSIFPLDRYWLEINNRLQINKFLNKDKKNVVFKYLSLQKRTKKGLIKAQSQDFKYNIKELIYQHFKANKETITKKYLAKHIINILLMEKITMGIEQEIMEYLQGKSNHKFKSSIYLMKDIKKKLIKQDYYNLEDLKYEIYCVVDSFRVNDFIDDEIYKEYINFVNLLISEANAILKEKQESEKQKSEAMNVKLGALIVNQ